MQLLFFLILLITVLSFFILFLHLKRKYGSVSSKMKTDEEDLFVLGNLFWNVFNTSEFPIILLKDYKIVNCNKMAISLFGGKSEEIVGKAPFELSPEIQPDGSASAIIGKELFDKILFEGNASFEWRHRKINGELFLAQVSASSFETNGTYYAAATIRDITKSRQEETELQNYRLKLEHLVEEKTRQLENSYMELQAINEELDASNEELYASNEELHATNEELDLSNKALSKEIEEHKKTQAEKAIIEEKLNQFVSQSSEAIIIINDKGIVEDWNRTMAEITGISKEKALGSYIWDVTYTMGTDRDKAELVRERFKNQTIQFFEETKKGNSKVQVSESQIQHSDSSLRYIYTTLFPIVTQSTIYGGVIISDITQKKATEAQLEEYRTELEKLLEQRTERLEQLSLRFNEVYANSSDAITFMDILDDGQTIKVFDMNPVAKRLFKISDEQLDKGVLIEELLPEIKIDSFKQNILPKLLSGVPVTFTDGRDTGNGYWNSTIYPIKDDAGKVYRIAAFSRNVTAEHEQEKLSAILNSAIESWPYEFWVSDKDGVCILQNLASKKLWGNLIGKRLTDLDIPLDTKQKSIADELNALQGKSSSSELLFETANGPRYVLAKLNPISSKNEIKGILGVSIDITELKHTEIALQESKKRLSQLLSSVTDYKFTVEFENGKATKTVHSEGCMAVTGYSPDDFQNNPYLWFEIVHHEDKPYLEEWAKKVEKGHDVAPFEHRIIRKDGEPIWVTNTTVFKKDSQGNILGFDGLISDITKRKNAELALRESEKRFYDAVDLQPVPIGIIIDGKPLLYNKSFTEKFGYTIEDVPTVEKWIEKAIIDRDLREKILTDVKDAITRTDNYEITRYEKDYKIRCKDGSEKWIEIYDRRIGNMLITVFNDITERRQAEEKIRLSEEKYRLLAGNIDDVIWKLDINTLKYTYCSPSIFKLTGYTVKEALNLKPDQILMPDSYEHLSIALLEWVNQYNKTGQGINKTFEYQIRHKNGQPVWVEINAAFITDNTGAIKEIVATSRSIEERRAIQSLIAESEEKLRTIFETSKDGIVVIDQDLHILEINPEALNRSGYQYEEIRGKSIFGFLLKENLPDLLEYLKSLWNTKASSNFETEIIIKDKGFFPVEISASTMEFNQNEVLLIMIRDISERKQHEKELLQSVINTEERERVNFSQELHDGLGPLLSAAKMYVEWLAEPDSTVEPEKIIPDIKKLLDESTKTVKDISFKLSPHILQNYGVLESLKAYAEKVEKTGKTHIHMEAVNIPRFDEITETIVYRVVCECINNTLKHANANKIVINMRTADNSLVIKYSDDGKGFDVEKVRIRNKGIGLLNMQSRLRSINGSFSIQSSLNNGTSIYIKVPINVK